jgi:hypothetical protein
MAEFTFFQQQRADGGVRTGLDISGTTVWQAFRPGADPESEDPALRWYIDIDGDGETIPSDRDELREWLLRHSPIIEAALDHLAERFAVGFDTESWPVAWQVPGSPDDGRLEIVISATRRTAAVEIGQVLRELKSSFRRLVNTIPRSIPVA